MENERKLIFWAIVAGFIFGLTIIVLFSSDPAAASIDDAIERELDKRLEPVEPRLEYYLPPPPPPPPPRRDWRPDWRDDRPEPRWREPERRLPPPPPPRPDRPGERDPRPRPDPGRPGGPNPPRPRR